LRNVYLITLLLEGCPGLSGRTFFCSLDRPASHQRRGLMKQG
jgi:hypothetical protein